MQKFLFATDFEADAQGVFKYTCLLAKKLNAEIIMLHAFGDGTILSKKETNEKGTAVIANLKDFVSTHLPINCQDIAFQYVADDQYAYQVIPSIASEEYIDVVVMGMKQGSHSFSTLIGSIALEVFLSIDCAILIVPEGFRTNKIKNLGCTTDFKFKDIALINLLRSLGAKLDKEASIHCLHVFEDNEDIQRVEKDMKILKSVFDERKGITVDYEVESGKLRPTIESFALNKELDLMAMNSHQRGTIGKIMGLSLTKSVAMTIQVPLFILKDL